MDYSPDFRTAIMDMADACSNVIKQLPNEDKNAKMIVNNKLIRVNKLIAELMHDVYPEHMYAECQKCHITSLVETAYWSGTCWNCAMK